MAKVLRLLIVEDSDNDLQLLLRELRRNGYEVIYECVDNAPAMQAAIENTTWDLVISDYSMPKFSAPEALALTKRNNDIDIPFIIISGSVGEENVVTALLAGARDFITKNNFSRLIPAIERELREAQDRQAKRDADKALRNSVSRYRLLFDSNPLPLWVYDLQTLMILAVNDAAIRHYGYTQNEFLNMSVERLRPVENNGIFLNNLATAAHNGSNKITIAQHQKKDGTVIDVEITAHDLDFESHAARLVLSNDITQRKQSEERLYRYNQRLKILHNIDRSILMAQSPETICGFALEFIVSQISVWGASITVFDLETNTGTVFASYSTFRDQWPTGKEFVLDQFISKNISTLQEGNALYIEDLFNQKSLTSGLRGMRMKGMRSYLSIPLIAQTKLIGSLNLGSVNPQIFISEQSEMVHEIADQLAIAIQQFRYAEQIRQHTAKLETHVIRRTAELQRTTDRVEAILNNSSDAILLTSFDGVIQQVNPAFNELFGYEGHEILGESLLNIASLEDIMSLLEALSSVIKTRKSTRIEILSCRKDGSQLTTEVSLAVIVRESTIHGVVCGVRDISERISMEQNLRTALNKEKELSELKSRFSSMVSHEFRTPLTVIRSSTWLIQRYDDRMEAEKKKEHLNQIQTQIERLTTLLDDVLTLSRAETVTLDVRTELIDLQAFSIKLVTEIQQTTQKHEIAVAVIGEPKKVQLDAKLIHQMISNLLTNAVKYSPEGGTVTLELTYDLSKLIIKVKDQGIGIPETDQARLFEVFHRAQNVGNISGTGLGLPIVKRAVEAHGGEIDVESALGMGTTFIIRIPL